MFPPALELSILTALIMIGFALGWIAHDWWLHAPSYTELRAAQQQRQQQHD